MAYSSMMRKGIVCSVLILLASPAVAQIEDNLKSYSGSNGTGYFGPLIKAISTNMNTSPYHTADIPANGLVLRLEVPVMGLIFSDDEKTFNAVTEGNFSPRQTVEAPTVVGSGNSVTVDGDGGTSYTFPGGLDLNSLALTVPQLRIGAVAGTEALVRFIALNIGDTDLGKLNFFGLGIRHSISQYFGPAPPVNVAASFTYQRFKLGENEDGSDLSLTNTYSFGIQVSTRYVQYLVPYTGLSYDTYSTDVEYQYERLGETEDVTLDFTGDTLHWLIGLNLDLYNVYFFAEYNVASQNSFALGLGFGI
jgi:hypothetical protein